MNAKQVNADITALLRARNTLLWITSREEQRVERALTDACGAAKYLIRYWDCSTGITEWTVVEKTDQKTGQKTSEPVLKTVESNGDPNAALRWLRGTKQRTILVMRDLHRWFDPMILRTLRSLSRELQSAVPNEARAIILLTPSSEVPIELSGATVIDYPLPDRDDVTRIIDDVITALPAEIRDTATPNGARELAIDAALGLSAEEIANTYSRSLVTTKTIDPAMVASEKRRIIARERVLTWHDPDPRGLDAIGGLDLLKQWLRARRAAFTQEARDFGLDAPRGALLLGIPGCGKSLTAKAVASAWQMPLLRLDMGALRSKYVGESEGNIRKALRVAETVSPCILWADEIEKALAGAGGPAGDGGVAADALGTLLSWMQEREGNVFVIATANEIRGLPPELLRKGRFDEIFWVDLPTRVEREQIIAAALRQRRRFPEARPTDPTVQKGVSFTAQVDLAEVARFTEGFTGAEISALVPDALFTAFEDGQRQICTEDLHAAARTVVPLSKTARERLDSLRDWARERARKASTPEDEAGGDTRTLDL